MIIHNFSKTFQEPNDYQSESNQSGKILQQLKNHNNKHVNLKKKIQVVYDQQKLYEHTGSSTSTVSSAKFKKDNVSLVLQFKTFYQDHVNSGSQVDTKTLWTLFPKNEIQNDKEEKKDGQSQTTLQQQQNTYESVSQNQQQIRSLDGTIKTDINNQQIQYQNTINPNLTQQQSTQPIHYGNSKTNQSINNNINDLNKILEKYIIQGQQLNQLAEQQYKDYILGLFDVIQKSLDGDISGCLYLKQLNQDFLQPFIVNPAVIAVNYYLQQKIKNNSDIEKEQKKQLPKITFINLDGFDNINNVQTLNEFKHQAQYISLFDDEVQDINFGQVNSTYKDLYKNEEQAILSQQQSFMSQIINLQLTKGEKNNNFFYPFHSLYLLNQYAEAKNHSSQKKDLAFNLMNKRITSGNFYYLFSKVIQRLISSHNPDIIMISYTMAFNKYTHYNKNGFSLNPKKMQAIFKLLNKENPQANIIFIPRIISAFPNDEHIQHNNVNLFGNQYKLLMKKFSVDVNPPNLVNKKEEEVDEQAQKILLQTQQYIFSICASFLNVISLDQTHITAGDMANSAGQFSQSHILFLHSFFRTMKALTLLYNQHLKFFLPSNVSMTQITDLLKVKETSNLITQSCNPNFKQTYVNVEQLVMNTSDNKQKLQANDQIISEDENYNLNQLTQNQLFEKLANQPKFKVFKKLLNYNYRNSLTICLLPKDNDYNTNPKLVQIKFMFINNQNIQVPLEIAHPVQYYVDYQGSRVFFFNILDNGVFRNLVFNISDVLTNPNNNILKNYTQELPNDWNQEKNKNQLLIDFTMVMQEQQYLYIIWGLLYNMAEFLDNNRGIGYVPQKSNNIYRINLNSLSTIEKVNYSYSSTAQVDPRIFSSAIYIQEQNKNFIYIFGGITDLLASFALSSTISELSFDQSNQSYTLKNLDKKLVGPDSFRGYCRSIPLRIVNPILTEAPLVPINPIVEGQTFTQGNVISQIQFQQKDNQTNNKSSIDQRIQKLLTGMYIFGGSFSKYLLDQSSKDAIGYIFFYGLGQKNFKYGLKKLDLNENKSLKNFFFSSQNYNILQYKNDVKITYIVISEHVKKNLKEFINIKKEKIFNFNEKSQLEISEGQSTIQQSNKEFESLDTNNSRLMVCYIKLSFNYQYQEKQTGQTSSQHVSQARKKFDFEKLKIANYENSDILSDTTAIISFNNKLASIMLYNDVKQQEKKPEIVYAQVFFNAGGSSAYIKYLQSQKLKRCELVLDRESSLEQDGEPNKDNKIQAITRDFQIDSLFVDGKTVYALSQGTLVNDTVGSTHIYQADISSLEANNQISEIIELKFKPLSKFQQSMQVQKESSIVVDNNQQMYILGGKEMRIYCDIQLLERELSIPYKPRNSINFKNLDFSNNFYENKKNEEKIRYMRYHQKEITEINLMNCKNIFYFFVNFLAQSDIKDGEKLKKIYERLKDEIAYPDMGLNLRKINLEEFTDNYEQQGMQMERAGLIENQLEQILDQKFVRHFKFVDNFSLRKVKCRDPYEILKALNISGLKIQSLDISQFISFYDCGLPCFDLETLAYLNRHCKSEFIEQMNQDIEKALKQLECFMLKKINRKEEVIKQYIERENYGNNSTYTDDTVKQIKEQILKKIFQYEFSDFFKNLVTLRMQNTKLNSFIVDIFYYIYKPILTKIKLKSRERAQERETTVPKSAISNASRSNFKIIKYAIKLVEVDFSNFQYTESSNANNLDTQSVSKLLALVTPYAQKIIMHHQSKTQFLFNKQENEIMIYNKSSLVLDQNEKGNTETLQESQYESQFDTQKQTQFTMQATNIREQDSKETQKNSDYTVALHQIIKDPKILNQIQNEQIKQCQISSGGTITAECTLNSNYQQYKKNINSNNNQTSTQTTQQSNNNNKVEAMYKWFNIYYSEFIILKKIKNIFLLIEGFKDVTQDVKIAHIMLQSQFNGQTIYELLKDIYEQLKDFPNNDILITISYQKNETKDLLTKQKEILKQFHNQIEKTQISLPIRTEIRQTNCPLHIISDSYFNFAGFNLIQNTISEESQSQTTDFSLRKDKDELSFQIFIKNQQNNYLCLKDQAFSQNIVQNHLDQIKQNQNKLKSNINYITISSSQTSFSQETNYQIDNDKVISSNQQGKQQEAVLIQQPDDIKNVLLNLKHPYLQKKSEIVDLTNKDYSMASMAEVQKNYKIDSYEYPAVKESQLVLVTDDYLLDNDSEKTNNQQNQLFRVNAIAKAEKICERFAYTNLKLDLKLEKEKERNQPIQQPFQKNIRDISKSASFCQDKYLFVFQKQLLIENRSLNRYKVYFEIINYEKSNKDWVPGYVIFENEEIEGMQKYEIIAVYKGQRPLEFIIVLDTSNDQDHEIYSYSFDFLKEHLESNDQFQVTAKPQQSEGIYLQSDTILSMANSTNTDHQNLIFNEANYEVISLTQFNQ